MKSIMLVACLLTSFTSFSKSIECQQDQGDDRYDLLLSEPHLVIVHTNDSDETSTPFYDTATLYEDTQTISGGRYIVNLNMEGYSSLYKLVGREKVLLSDTLYCNETENTDTDAFAVGK